MTELASRLVREGLANEHRTTGSVVAEEPPAHDPVGRKERTDHHRQRTSPAH
jgi:hypothetical protein